MRTTSTFGAGVKMINDSIIRAMVEKVFE